MPEEGSREEVVWASGRKQETIFIKRKLCTLTEAIWVVMLLHVAWAMIWCQGGWTEAWEEDDVAGDLERILQNMDDPEGKYAVSFHLL